MPDSYPVARHHCLRTAHNLPPHIISKLGNYVLNGVVLGCCSFVLGFLQVFFDFDFSFFSFWLTKLVMSDLGIEF